MGSSESLNIIFAGTPEFAAVALQALLQSHHKVIAVYTQPDRPAGRGRKLTSSPVKQLALQHNIAVHQPLSLCNEKEQKILADLKADVMVVVAYGLLLPLPILNAPRLGCINIHGSLLPRWRGAAPIQRAILAGDSETGVTIMQMDVGLDTGPMLNVLTCPIELTDTSETMYERLAQLGAKGMLETLAQLANGTAKPVTQDNTLATHASKITKEEAELDFNLSAVELARKIRSFNPWPIAYVRCHEHNMRVWQAESLEGDVQGKQAGSIVAISPQGIDVATGSGILRLQKVQFPGGRVMPVSDLLNSRQHDFSVGTMLESL